MGKSQGFLCPFFIRSTTHTKKRIPKSMGYSLSVEKDEAFKPWLIKFEVVEDCLEVVPVLGLIQEFKGGQDCIIVSYGVVFDLIYEVSAIHYDHEFGLIRFHGLLLSFYLGPGFRFKAVVILFECERIYRQ